MQILNEQITQTMITTVITIIIFLGGLYYEKIKKRDRSRRLFAAEFFTNYGIADKIIAKNSKLLTKIPVDKLSDNDLAITDEREYFFSPLLETAFNDLIDSGLPSALTLKQSEDAILLLQYHSQIKRLNWLIDRVKAFKVRPHMIIEINHCCEEIKNTMDAMNHKFSWVVKTTR